MGVRFRRDLEVTPRQQGSQRAYLIRNASGDAFEFGEEDYFLCQSLDGRASPEEIAERFRSFFNKPISETDVQGFAEEIEKLGLGERVNGTKPSKQEKSQRKKASLVESGTEPVVGEESSERSTEEDDEDSTRVTRYRLVDPSGFFSWAARLLGWIQVFAWPLSIALIAGGITGIWLLFSRQNELTADQQAAGMQALPYLGKLVLTLFTLNFLRCLVQGIVLTKMGGQVEEAGIRMRFGLIPRFYIDRSALRQLERGKRMWCYASTVLTRLGMLAGGGAMWLTFQPTSARLAGLGILFLHAGFIGLLLVTVPLRGSDGFKWLCTWRGWPDNLIQQALQIGVRFVQRKPIPVSRSRAFWMLLYAAVLIGTWTTFLLWFAARMADGLNETFPDIFGRSTEFILLAVILVMVGRWFLDKLPGVRQAPDPGEAEKKNGSRTAWIIAGAVLILLLPFPYRPGGNCTLLPPAAQPVEALETGFIAEVLHRGGDGQVIKAGTALAIMRSPEIENEAAQTRELLRNQQATLAKERANLRSLNSGARKEELDAAMARLERAQADVESGVASLEAANIGAEYAANEVNAYEPLAAQGAYAQLLLEEKRKQAKLAQTSIGEAQQALEAFRKSEAEALAELTLLKAGARPEEVEAAEQTVAAVEAEVARLQAFLDFIEGQKERLTLRMPIDGVLVESHLERRIGSRLEPGEEFATAQEPGLPLVEVALPEAEAEDVLVGAPAEVRLVANAARALQGQVEAIEPAASEEEITQVVRVLVQLEEAARRRPLKAGMTGYCKIDAGYRPLGYLLVRPLFRFFQVEVWSWLP